ncbi:histidine kinase [Olivibacter ginsenosidimutans]|uniref:Histidine kinase n=1 Tax=Olivibacter ginsenosidimutans TaxID=1176537 RepID=A0ABP9BEC1_9SPHI
MYRLNRKTIWIIFTHLLLWGLLGFLLLFYPPLTWGIKLPPVFWAKQSYVILSLGIIFYANYLFFTPKLLFSQRSALFILWLLVAIAFEQYIVFGIDQWLNFHEIMATVRQRPPRHPDIIDGFMLMMTLLVLGISTSIAAVRQWQRDVQLKEALQRQQIASELSFLKAQINPHFFFNTLNTIYALSYNDVELSRQALHKLSRMMRYLLYETQQHQTSLVQELKFMKDHIELMQLRLHPNNEVIYRELTLTRDYTIAPMLLLPFVENAFKHGIRATKPSSIIIDVRLEQNTLYLEVSNTLHEGSTPAMEEGSGIGLQNTKRRLNLLYPNKHKLTIEKSTDHSIYQVKLMLTLS